MCVGTPRDLCPTLRVKSPVSPFTRGTMTDENEDARSPTDHILSKLASNIILSNSNQRRWSISSSRFASTHKHTIDDATKLLGARLTALLHPVIPHVQLLCRRISLLVRYRSPADAHNSTKAKKYPFTHIMVKVSKAFIRNHFKF